MLDDKQLEDKGWQNMAEILEKEMPQKENRIFFWWGAGALVLLLLPSLYFLGILGSETAVTGQSLKVVEASSAMVQNITNSELTVPVAVTTGADQLKKEGTDTNNQNINSNSVADKFNEVTEVRINEKSSALNSRLSETKSSNMFSAPLEPTIRSVATPENVSARLSQFSKPQSFKQGGSIEASSTLAKSIRQPIDEETKIHSSTKVGQPTEKRVDINDLEIQTRIFSLKNKRTLPLENLQPSKKNLWLLSVAPFVQLNYMTAFNSLSYETGIRTSIGKKYFPWRLHTGVSYERISFKEFSNFDRSLIESTPLNTAVTVDEEFSGVSSNLLNIQQINIPLYASYNTHRLSFGLGILGSYKLREKAQDQASNVVKVDYNDNFRLGLTQMINYFFNSKFSAGVALRYDVNQLVTSFDSNTRKLHSIGLNVSYNFGK